MDKGEKGRYSRASKGGKARANALSPEERSAIAKRAAMARWRKPAELGDESKKSDVVLSPPTAGRADKHAEDNYHRPAEVFRTMADPIAVAVLEYLSRGWMSAEELARNIGVSKIIIEY